MRCSVSVGGYRLLFLGERWRGEGCGGGAGEGLRLPAGLRRPGRATVGAGKKGTTAPDSGAGACRCLQARLAREERPLRVRAAGAALSDSALTAHGFCAAVDLTSWLKETTQGKGRVPLVPQSPGSLS